MTNQPIRRKRGKCLFCSGLIYVAQNTPDAERQACRDCRRLGYREPDNASLNNGQRKET